MKEKTDTPVVRWASTVEIKTVEWLWKPLIPKAKVTIVQGDGGEGKTTMMLAVAAMLSRGIKPPTMLNGSLLPQETCEPINIFYASTEEEIADSALPRFIRNGGDVERFAFSGELSRHLLLKEEDIRSAIEQSNAGLMIIDPVQAFLPVGATMTNVNAMRPIFTMLSNVAMETGCSIVLIGHMNKNEGAKDIHRGLGSADIAASVRSILLVHREREQNMSIVRAVKSNFDESDYSPIGLALDAERKLYFVDMNPVVEEEAEETEAEEVEENCAEEHSPKQKEAIETAKELLSGGDLESGEFKELVMSAGINYRNFMRAKKQYGGFSSYRFEGKTYWTVEE